MSEQGWQPNILGDHECFRCGNACDCAQPSECQMCERCYREIKDEGIDPPVAEGSHHG